MSPIIKKIITFTNTQIMVIFLAFALMVSLSSWFMSSIVRKHLVTNAQTIIDSLETNITVDLQEPRTVLGNLSQTVRSMILKGDDGVMVQRYLKEINDYILFDDEEKHFSGFSGIYGFFDVYDGLFLDSLDRIPPEDYVPTERPWYKEAVSAGGKIVLLQPYADIATTSVVITYTRSLFDDEGQLLGAIALDLQLERIADYIVNANLGTMGYGFLLGEQMEFFSNTNREIFGQKLTDVNSASAALAEKMKREYVINEYRMNNFEGNPSVVFARRLENGWYLGIVTPEGEYYRELKTIRFILIILGVLLASVLSAILFNIVSARKKSDERMMSEIRQREDLLNMVNSVAGVLLSVKDEKTFEDSLIKSFELVGQCLDVDRVHIWHNEKFGNKMHFVHRYEWLSDYGRICKSIPIGFHLPYSVKPEWERSFLRGECINAALSGMPEHDFAFLNAYNMKSVAIIPIFLDGSFWGFFSIDDCRTERTFSDDEIHILTSVGLMMGSAVNRNIQIAKVREADERTQVMLDATPLCANFWSRNLDELACIDCNQEAVNLFGLASKKEYNEKFFELSPEYQPDGRLSKETAIGLLRKAFDEGYCRFEWMHQKLNGEPIPCEIILVRVKYKNDFIVAGYTRDLRELKTTIAQMNESQKSLDTLKNILNGIDAMIYVTIPQTGEILFINDSMKDHYKIEGDCIGKFCYKILQEGMDHKCEFCPCHRLDKEPHSTVVWEEHSTLTKRVYRNTDRYIEWHDGVIAHIQHSVDLTELITAKEMAEQSSRFKSQFLSRMSHEVRTPMNAILGITEIQMQNKALSPDLEEALGRIYNSGYLLLGIINDILDLSKIEAGKLELALVNYDVPSLINDTVYLNIMRFDSKPIVFDLQVDENIPLTLFGDELRIKQILNNLLSNAFKYTDSGKVILSLAVEPADEAGKIMLVLRVSDTGQGMTVEHVANLFNEYARFNMAANRRTEGAGLGMSITRYLVGLMNGEIFVESEPGKGSLFTVRFPQEIVDDGVLGKAIVENLKQFRLGKKAQMKKAPQIVREHMPYGKVLIVDDVETNLYVARGLMFPYGLSIETAGSGFEAVEKIRNGAVYDIVFMDHFMPRMDGIETVKIIRDMKYAYPIIALTANALTGQAEMFMMNGFDGFISKPIDIYQLNSVLNKLIRDKHQGKMGEAKWQHLEDNLNKYTTQPPIDHLLVEAFARDAEKAAAILEAIQENNYRRGDDLQMYVINAHAMKSALANIGETELSGTALKLEGAGREQNIDFISKETPAFLTALHAVIEKLKPNKGSPGEKNSGDIQDDDRAYLLEKLAVIQKTCAEYDKKDAKDALTQLRQKTWPPSVEELLDNIAEQLLHSEFAQAAKLAGDYIEALKAKHL
ncbi:MAG: response regulator [Treponema sp.]|nr:response regulator [Treponema sp.]